MHFLDAPSREITTSAKASRDVSELRRSCDRDLLSVKIFYMKLCRNYVNVGLSTHVF